MVKTPAATSFPKKSWLAKIITRKEIWSSWKNAENAKNFSQYDSLLIGDKCGVHIFPDLEIDNDTAQIEQEVTYSKLGEDQLYYYLQRG